MKNDPKSKGYFQCCNAHVSPTDDKWKSLKVMCGIFIIVVMIIALIGMLWWLPGNGNQWLSYIYHILLGMFLVLNGNSV